MIQKQTGTLAAAIAIAGLALLGCGPTEPGHAPEGVRSAAEKARDATDRILRAPELLPRLRDAGAGPFDLDRPTVANLDPDLLEALQAAARDAQDDRVGIVVTSGWRSRAHQQRLYDEAVSEYGSEDEARRWVSTPDTSAHVTGDAVDLGPADADEWLSEHGSDYGLCQVFANEAWHYELATIPGGRCPDLLPDSSSR